MGQSAQTQDMFSVPSGGIADFYMSDEDIAVIEQEEAQKAFGSEGVAAFDGVAKRMASYGRFGDDRIVHVESGEIVVPRALIEQSPELKESIFSHLREQGVEDPERYVVGSSANSLNPETGLPEFFLSKIAKKVGKVLKKAAPVVLPLVLANTPLGAVYGAALGSGIGTLMQGGSIDDALKSAVIAGGTGAIFKGFTGNAGSFGANIKAELANPGARFSQLGQGITGEQNFFRSFDTSAVAGTPTTGSGEAVQMSETGQFDLASNQPQVSQPNYNPETGQFDLGNTRVPGTKVADTSFLDRAQEFIMPSDPTAADIAQKSKELMQINPSLSSADATALATKELTPGFIEKFGPSVALAGLGAGALGFFDTPEEEEVTFVTGADLLEQDRDKYALPDEQIQYVAPYDPFVPQRPVMQAAEGGVADVFPRRTGGIMPDEGIAGEDSVRAMLMPGEFVMTTDAVKGLGNGDNDQGIRKMYDMMRGLESKGRAMA